MFCWIHWNIQIIFLWVSGKIGMQNTTAVTETIYSLLSLNPAMYVFSLFYLCSFIIVLWDIYTNVGGGNYYTRQIHSCVS